MPQTDIIFYRPEADYLRDDIYELRASLRGIHYRILYFFHGHTAVVLSHGIVKERVVPPKEIDRAVLRTAAGLSQRELAKRVGTSASVICRLEDADDEGHSLSLLRRIAATLDQQIEIAFRPKQPKLAVG